MYITGHSHPGRSPVARVRGKLLNNMDYTFEDVVDQLRIVTFIVGTLLGAVVGLLIAIVNKI